jgi:hypothetical protein
MRICDFDGTETDQQVCPTCNDYKGLTTAEEKRTFGMITLSQAVDNAMRLMEEAYAHHRENPCDDAEDCEVCRNLEG